ncbi:MAG: hypothetical protein MUF23_15410 [Pirellula sp.]|nr:hypothetical protein [Pirellula sp.]
MDHFIASRLRRTSKSVAVFCALAVALSLSAFGQNQVVLEVIDPETGNPVPARLDFTKSGKKLSRDRKTLGVGESWLAEGTVTLQPAPGDYEFLARRGPEFNSIRGGFTIERGSRDTVAIEIPRSISMHEEGWYSGDLSAEVDANSLARWQLADALDMVVQTTLSSKNKGVPEPAASKVTKQKDAPKWGGPEEVGYRWSNRSIEYRSPHVGLALHRTTESTEDPFEALEAIEGDAMAMAEVTQLLAADLPLWLAHPKVRCARLLGLANRDKGDALLALGRGDDSTEFGKLLIELGKDRWSIPVLAPFPAKDRIRFRGPRGAGMLSEAIYWQALEAGLRLTPTAASGFGGSDTFLGYNRVYAYLDSEPSHDAWWEALVKGEVFVTNGPLLRVMVNGVPPGTVQASYRNEPIPLDIAVSLAVRDPVDYLDVIFNGETLYNAKLEDHYRKGEFPPLQIDRSGWLVVRVVTSHEAGYRVATTAPFYFAFDGNKRISKKAVAFFREWLDRTEKVTEGSVMTESRSRAIERARAFWSELDQQSNAP